MAFHGTFDTTPFIFAVIGRQIGACRLLCFTHFIITLGWPSSVVVNATLR
jgi:hypothetical protein